MSDYANGCVFCRIIAGEAPARIVFEDDDVLAFHDKYPQAPQHLLVIPKKHISKLHDATASEAALLGSL